MVWLSTVQGAWASRPSRNTSSSVLFSPAEVLPWNRHTANAARDSAAHDHAGGLKQARAAITAPKTHQNVTRGLEKPSQHSHSTVTAQSQHSHSTKTHHNETHDLEAIVGEDSTRLHEQLGSWG